MRVKAIGEITAFDPATQLATVKLLTNPPNKSLNQNYVNLPAPILVEVPVEFPRCGGFSITMPITPGDDCIVEFYDSGIDSWLYENRREYKFEGGRPEPAALRRFALGDASCRVAIGNLQNVITGFDDGLCLRNTAGDQKIILRPDGTIEILSGGDINMTAGGSMNITAGELNISAGKVSMTKA